LSQSDPLTINQKQNMTTLTTDHKLFTTNGILLDADGFEAASGIWAFIQDGLLIVNSTPHAIWDVRVYDNRLEAKSNAWTLLF